MTRVAEKISSPNLLLLKEVFFCKFIGKMMAAAKTGVILTFRLPIAG